MKQLFTIQNKMTKALVLFSGGLDSILAVKVLESQGIDCTAITFCTPFFGKEKAETLAQKNGIKIKTVDISDKHIKILKNPKYGYGKNMNPCIDCHGFMIKTAFEIAEKEGFDIIASGEVIGQRPMSQTTRGLNAVNKVSGKEILRPLSAKLIKETEYEKSGLVDRSKLLDISGRGRQKQIQLAKNFGLMGYEMPGGGCLLTQEGYSEKLKSLFNNFKENIQSLDTELIKYGRLKVFSRGFTILGRDNKDNEKLYKLTQNNPKYKIAHLIETTGPLAIIKIIKDGYNEADIVNFYKEKVQKLKDLKILNIQYI